MAFSIAWRGLDDLRRACEALSGKSGAGPPCAVREALNKMPDFVRGEPFGELGTGLPNHT